METAMDNRKKAEMIAEILKNDGFKAPYQRTWTTMANVAMTQKPIEIPEIPSFRKMGIKAQCARAIQEAHDGAKAMDAKTKRMGRLLGMSYLLNTESMQLIDEAELMMDRQLRAELGLGVCLKKMNNAFDEFATKMKEHISAEMMIQFAADIKAFDENVRAFADIAGYKVETEEDKRKSNEQRLINLHKEILDKGDEFKQLYGEDALRELFARIKEMDAKETKEQKDNSTNS